MRGGGGMRGNVKMVSAPPLDAAIEAGFHYISLLDFFLPDNEEYGCVTKNDEVSTDFCEQVKTHLRADGRCPLTSGHVRIPFGLTITGRIPADGVNLGARPLGEDTPVMACHLIHMPVGPFMEYIAISHGLPVVNYLGPIAESNSWTTETVDVDTYTLRDMRHESNIIPDEEDVRKLVERARRQVLDTRGELARLGAAPDDVDEAKGVVQHDVNIHFEAGTACSQYSTMSASKALFPHVDGYDIAAIIPVTLQVQVQVGHCEICTQNCSHLKVLCANKHEMCVTCIARWTAKGNETCPFCRAPLLSGASGDAAMNVCAANGHRDPFDLQKSISNIYVLPL